MEKENINKSEGNFPKIQRSPKFIIGRNGKAKKQVNLKTDVMEMQRKIN